MLPLVVLGVFLRIARALLVLKELFVFYRSFSAPEMQGDTGFGRIG
jgi:hypothetical protein